MNRREFCTLTAAAATALVLPTVSSSTERVVWSGVPVFGELDVIWDLLWPQPLAKETTVQRAILSGQVVRCVVVEFRDPPNADDTLPAFRQATLQLREKVGQLQAGEQVSPLRMYLSEQRPDLIRLEAYVVRS